MARLTAKELEDIKKRHHMDLPLIGAWRGEESFNRNMDVEKLVNEIEELQKQMITMITIEPSI